MAGWCYYFLLVLGQLSRLKFSLSWSLGGNKTIYLSRYINKYLLEHERYRSHYWVFFRLAKSAIKVTNSLVSPRLFTRWPFNNRNPNERSWEGGFSCSGSKKKMSNLWVNKVRLRFNVDKNLIQRQIPFQYQLTSTNPANIWNACICAAEVEYLPFKFQNITKLCRY